MKENKRHGYGILISEEGYYYGYWSNDKAAGLTGLGYKIYKWVFKICGDEMTRILENEINNKNVPE